MLNKLQTNLTKAKIQQTQKCRYICQVKSLHIKVIFEMYKDLPRHSDLVLNGFNAVFHTTGSRFNAYRIEQN